MFYLRDINNFLFLNETNYLISVYLYFIERISLCKEQY